MEFLELKAKPRTTKGNSPARALRRDGAIPAVIYGPGKASVALSVNVYDIEQALKGAGGRQIFVDLAIEGGETRKAMLKELQRHPVNGSFIHADFYEVALDRKMRVMIPVTTVGKCQGVEMGGMLQIIRRELEALCFPTDIPDEIEIDITELDMGESVHVEDITLEGDVELVHDVNFTVLTILAGREEEEEVEEGEEGEEGEVAEGEEETAEAPDAE
ncbi:MAG: 50S ribosomal protein L25 [Desulfobacteraceae bacterium]|nr:50S ribosomal protein L25 [Desulfobacteraceae bacterium]MBC2751826.1 50S ribosomal protein L25 [Desulfobacteraceae bacterium]